MRLDLLRRDGAKIVTKGRGSQLLSGGLREMFPYASFWILARMWSKICWLPILVLRRVELESVRTVRLMSLLASYLVDSSILEYSNRS